MAKLNAGTGQFTIELNIPAAPDRVWHAWATRDEFAIWFNLDDDWYLRVPEFDFRVGGGFRAEFGPQGAEPYIEIGKYLKLDEGREIVLSSDMVHQDEVFEVTEVTITIAPDGTGTRLTVTETGIQPDSVNDRKDGWTATMGSLNRYLTRA